jgi:hypothetical protein
MPKLTKNQKLLTDRLSVPKKKYYYLPSITKSNINNANHFKRNLQRLKSLKRTFCSHKENKPTNTHFGSFYIQTKKIKLKPKKPKKLKKDKNKKFLKISKAGSFLYKSIVTNRRKEFD